MPKDTKERILAAAMEMFSQKGYDGTNIRELTASLGLVKSAMYRHFESKEEIWNALLDEMIAYYAEHFGSPERLPDVPDSLEELVTMTMRMVDFTIHDERIVMTRKLLTIEQFRDGQPCDEILPHRIKGDVYPCFFRYDGQRSVPSGRRRDAGLCLHRANLRADSPLRPGTGENGRGRHTD